MTSIGTVVVRDNVPVKVMGIINISPESFYENSIKTSAKEIANTARKMQQDGAHIIDIGAMSTAPYLKTAISVEEEVKRMKYAIAAVKKGCNLPISIDTPRSEVAKEAIKYGIDAINDITGLKYDKNMSHVVSKTKIPVIMGASGIKRSCSTLGNISGTINILNESLEIAKRARIHDKNILIDPSIGFFRLEGRNSFFTKIRDLAWYTRDIEVISKLRRLKVFSKPICISVSRKSFIGELFQLKTEERLAPSIACEIISVLNGANLIRTHDVKETVQTLTMLELLC
ncbi:MAG: dihydropteroate synthase [Nitrososphaeraceae archaeon]|nr:dihydropteroate synthase [Nitrososphaeraceae archaeon]MBV9669262.1 dihydropteroate synthase [Nitrososphaeraceae archaeon]